MFFLLLYSLSGTSGSSVTVIFIIAVILPAFLLLFVLNMFVKAIYTEKINQEYVLCKSTCQYPE